MSDQDAKCGICYPPTFTYDPPTAALNPEACPARSNHDIITRAYARLWQLEARLTAPLASGSIELTAAASVRAEIERLRTATP